MIKPRTAAVARWQLGALCAALSALIGLLLLVLPFGAWMAHLSYDLGFYSGFWRRADIPVNEATIVYMDEESHRRLNQPWKERWDRDVHARLIERLSALGARAIVFDLLFTEPGPTEADARLVAAAKAHGRVAVAAIQSPHLFEGEPIGSEVKRAFPALTEVAASGIVEQAGEDKAVRRHYFIAGQTNLPSLAWRAAELALGNPPAPARERWINYYGPPGFLPYLSYFEVFEPNPTVPILVSNKVVFVGALYSVGFTGGKNTDDFRTPYTATTGRLSPGVEINATCYLNLVRGDWLTRLPPLAEAGLVMALGAMFGWALAPLRPVRACIVGILGATLVALVSTGSAWQAQIWFPWVIVVLAQMPLALACSVLVHSRRLTLERRSFEQALALASEGRVVTTAGPEASSTAAGGSPRIAEPLVKTMPRPEFLRPNVARVIAPDLPAVPDHDLIRCIGQGAYGEVWLARDLIGSFHAVKLLRLGSFKSAAPMETEFEGLRKFTPISRSHPGFVHILHVGRDESQSCLFYVMELADDKSAGAKIDPETYSPRTLAGELSRRGRLPLNEVLQIGIRLADALEHLHRHQLIHRDIKPANILFVKGEPKFADIGLVTDVTSEGEAAGYLGTPGRMAPEGPGSPAADVFSLGKVLYEAGLGMEVDRFPELPKSMIESGNERGLFDFNRVIMRACEVDLRRRYASAAELRDELAALQQRLGKTNRVNT